MLTFVFAAMLAGGVPAQAKAYAVDRGPTAQAVAMDSYGMNGDLRRASDGLFYVTGMINAVPVRFLVDTGASTIVLTRDDALRAGLMPAEAAFDAQADTAKGRALMAWISIDELQVGGVRVRGISAAVAPEGLGVSLLGQNWVAELASLTIAGDRLLFR